MWNKGHRSFDRPEGRLRTRLQPDSKGTLSCDPIEPGRGRVACRTRRRPWGRQNQLQQQKIQNSLLTRCWYQLEQVDREECTLETARCGSKRPGQRSHTFWS